jgi:superfamily II DNA helicase RecQ
MRVYTAGKTVIYYNSVRKVQVLTEALNYNEYYHAAAKKEMILRVFVTGQKKVIMATSALKIRINISDIRMIYYIDSPRTLLDYTQENKRAGRNGLKNKVIIIVG